MILFFAKELFILAFVKDQLCISHTVMWWSRVGKYEMSPKIVQTQRCKCNLLLTVLHETEITCIKLHVTALWK